MEPRIAGYRLDRMVGRGASGDVWLAWGEGPTARPVAIKRIRAADPSGVDGIPHAGAAGAAAFRTEAEAVAGLDHPNVLGVLDVVADDHGVALVIPFARGGSLRDLLDERGTLAVGAVVALLRPVADALASVHRAGLVHGDLKPANILLTSDGVPMVADFGVATVSEPGTDATGSVLSPASVGRGGGAARAWAATPAYLDPNVADGGRCDARSEVFSLGVITYEALCGRLPHRGEPAHLLSLAAAGVHRHLGTWPGITAETAEAVEWALAARPEGRPPDAPGFIEAVAATVSRPSITLPGPARHAHQAVRPPTHETIAFGPAPPDGAPGPDRGRHRIARSLAAVAVLLVALAAMVGLAAAGSARPACRRPPGEPATACARQGRSSTVDAVPRGAVHPR